MVYSLEVFTKQAMKHKIFIKDRLSEFLLIAVEPDAFNFHLITNKELVRRYGRLEYTQRTNGIEHRLVIDDIEKYELLGEMTNNRVDKEVFEHINYNILAQNGIHFWIDKPGDNWPRGDAAVWEQDEVLQMKARVREWEKNRGKYVHKLIILKKVA